VGLISNRGGKRGWREQRKEQTQGEAIGTERSEGKTGKLKEEKKLIVMCNCSARSWGGGGWGRRDKRKGEEGGEDAREINIKSKYSVIIRVPGLRPGLYSYNNVEAPSTTSLVRRDENFGNSSQVVELQY